MDVLLTVAPIPPSRCAAGGCSGDPTVAQCEINLPVNSRACFAEYGNLALGNSAPIGCFEARSIRSVPGQIATRFLQDRSGARLSHFRIVVWPESCACRQ